MHIPVLLDEVINFLDPRPDKNYIDCTLGGGGHSLKILEKSGPKGKILGIDLDSEAIKNFQDIIKRQDLENRAILVNSTFANLKRITEEKNFRPVSGVILDLGFSSTQLEQGGRGLSFLKDEPLDMRFAMAGSALSEEYSTASEIVNNWPYEELVKIFREYGEERYAGPIAKLIVQERRKNKIRTTRQLAEAVARAKKRSPERINPATKIFQALRIAVNRELDNLKLALPQALEILDPEGRVAVISFHSLEDRIVKNFFRDQKQNGRMKVLTKKPVVPAEEERARNPRSRSAKLRVAEKIIQSNG